MEEIRKMLDRHFQGVAPSKLEVLAGKLGGLTAERALMMMEMGLGVAGSSLRAGLEFLLHGPDASRYLDQDGVRLWGRVARHLVNVNVETALRFFQNSVPVLDSLPPGLRTLALALFERQSIISSPVAMDCLLAGPKLVTAIDDENVAYTLYDIAYEISRRSATQSSELLMSAPPIVSFLRQAKHPHRDRHSHNEPPLGGSDRSAGRPPRETDALIEAALSLTSAFAHRAGGLATEFFTSLPQSLPESPLDLQLRLLDETRAFLDRGGAAAMQYFSVAGQILSQTGPRTMEGWTRLAHRIAGLGNAAVYSFLKVSPPVMSQLAALGRRESDDFTHDVLALVEEIAEQNTFLAIECFKSSPAALHRGSVDQLVQWARAGLRLYHHDLRHAHAYYALETRTSQTSLSELAGGVTLDQVGNTLRLYIQGLTGQVVTLNTVSAFSILHLSEDFLLGDGKTVYLPATISEFNNDRDNFRVYKILAAHAAGQIEFGTFSTDTPELLSVFEQLRTELTRPGSPIPAEPIGFSSILSLYPLADLATRIFTSVESGRIDSCLRRTYRGLCRDLEFFRRHLQGFSPAPETISSERVLFESLFHMALGIESSPGPTALPPGIKARLDGILQQTIRRPQASIADSLWATHEIYRLVTSPATQSEAPADADQMTDLLDDRAEPDPPSGLESLTDGQGWADTVEFPMGAEAASVEERMQALIRRFPVDANARAWKGRGEMPETDLEPGEHAYYYDEWDRELADYRAGWCRVIEKSARRGGRQFVEYVRSFYAPMISSIRYQFQLLRPEALKRIRGEIDGEDFDLQAVIDYALDRRTSGRVSERLYVRRLRKQRDVAVSFLLDMSSSTARTVVPGGNRARAAKRIIDIEKAGLVLMSEALEAVGDVYSIQGFTSEGRHQVKYYVVKDFQEPYGPNVEARIGGITYQNNTRLGAAIRHAAARLIQQAAQTKLLIVLSDGRPYDHDYGDSRYAREDTKIALRQVRMEDVIPFCITIDRESEGQLRDMYGEVGYTIIDDVLSLPERLPGIYRRLTR